MRQFCQDCVDDKVEIKGNFLASKSLFAGQYPNFLYLRSHYAKIFDLIAAKLEQGRKKILLLGSPGIGKSCFINYFIYRQIKELLSKGRKVFITYRCFSSDKSSLDRVQLESTWGDPGSDTQKILILDGVPLRDSDADDSAFNAILMVSSPNRLRYSCHARLEL